MMICALIHLFQKHRLVTQHHAWYGFPFRVYNDINIHVCWLWVGVQQQLASSSTGDSKELDDDEKSSKSITGSVGIGIGVGIGVGASIIIAALIICVKRYIMLLFDHCVMSYSLSALI
jgi:hypothetical protein